MLLAAFAKCTTDEMKGTATLIGVLDQQMVKPGAITPMLSSHMTGMSVCFGRFPFRQPGMQRCTLEMGGQMLWRAGYVRTLPEGRQHPNMTRLIRAGAGI